MFGLIVSSRPVDVSPQIITENQLAFKIPPTPSFSHIVVFLLPGAQLPPGTAASVYVQVPPSQEFRLLGGIGSGKESAIFKISGLKEDGATTATGGDIDLMTDDPASTPGATSEIIVGISMEPAAQVESQVLALKSQQQQRAPATTSNALVRQGVSGPSDIKLTTRVLAQRIIGNAFNFLASFGSDTVPLKAFQGWWDKFEKKIELDPGFLEREQ
nr:protein opi10 [Quercus suber]